MKLIPQWKEWWSLYSVWAIAALGLLGSAGDLLTLAWDYLDWPLWTKVFVYAVAAVAGIGSRLLSQDIEQ